MTVSVPRLDTAGVENLEPLEETPAGGTGLGSVWEGLVLILF